MNAPLETGSAEYSPVLGVMRLGVSIRESCGAVGITWCAVPSAAVEGVGCGWKVATSVLKLMGRVALA